MRSFWWRYRSFDRTVRLLLLNQLTINTGFYLLMPYLAAHLSGGLGLAAGVVGLVLGVRNLTQQGMFVVGGALADRFGFRTLIIAGCGLRTVGFAALGVAESLPALLAASAAVGLAGALFNPAVRAYLSAAAGTRRVEAFGVFNVFYSAGILIGPMAGVLLTGVAFRLTCAVAAAVFAGLTVLQVRALPPAPTSRPDAASAPTVGAWRAVAGNRRFLVFAAAMAGSYALSFQVYLALPLRVRDVVADPAAATAVTGGLFAVFAMVTIAAQVRVTDWCARRWPPGRSLTAGLALMTTAYVPLAVLGEAPAGPTVLAAAAAVALLALGSAVAYPFEMDTIVNLAQGRQVATHYGLYHTVAGVGIVAGNTGVGELLAGAGPAASWRALLAIGATATLGVHLLARSGWLTPRGGAVTAPDGHLTQASRR